MDDEHNYKVYMHVNKVDNKKYIGITKRKKPEWRWGKRGQKYNDTQYFWNAIQKYGWDGFDHLILFEGLTQEEAKQKEIEMIAKYKSNNRKFGYNLTAGGDMGNHLKGANSPFYGKHFNEEHRRKIAEFNKNRIRSPEEIKMATNRLLEYMKTHPSPWLGKHHTEESRKKMSLSQVEYFKTHKNPRLGMSLSDFSKQKIAESRLEKGLSHRVLCLETGKEYISLRKASEDTNISRDTIARCCKGLQESTKGFHFKYINSEEIKSTSNGRPRKVICVEKNKIYNSLAEAGRDFGVDKGNIWQACQSDLITVKGYHFKYYNK